MKKVLFFAALVCMFFACSKEDVEPIEEKIPLNISVGYQTKANDSQFEADDEVGIYVVNYTGETAGTLALSGNQVDNMRFTYSNSSWTPDEATYWKDKNTKADLFAYYPYDGNLASISAYPFSVKSDQSSEANFWGSDFLWGKVTKVSPTSSAVPIETNHMLSRIIIDIKPGAGFTNESWASAEKSVQITNIKTSATINLSTGVTTEQGAAGSIIPLNSGTSGTTISYMAMVIPQTVENDSQLVTITVDGVNYVYRKGYTFTANTKHTFTITVNKSGSSVDVTIGEWDIDDTVNGGDAIEEVESSTTNNQILYTATEKVEPAASADFGATIVSNEFENGEGIITFDGDVTSIGAYAFENNKSLTHITFPNSLTSVGKWAFYGCTALTGTITIPNNVVEIGEQAFYGAYNLTAFDGKFSSADKHCIVIDNTLIAFAAVSDFTSYTIPDNITSIGEYAFCENKALKEVVINDNIQVVGKGAFASCSNLENVSIGSGVTTIAGSAFFNCPKIVSVVIPASVQTIENCVFESCTSLASVYCKPSKVIQTGGYGPTWLSFDKNAANRKIYVPADLVSAYKATAGWSSYADYIEADPS